VSRRKRPLSFRAVTPFPQIAWWNFENKKRENDKDATIETLARPTDARTIVAHPRAAAA
jgi:hypothetical protein